MSGSADKTSIIAATRFGLGMGPKDLDAMGGDPKGWLLGQVDASNYKVADDAAKCDETARRIALAAKLQEDDTSYRRALASMDADAKTLARTKEEFATFREKYRAQGQEIHLEDVRRLMATAVGTNLPLRERLVRFWSNHFSVGVGKYTGWIGPLVAEEAIRPHLLGRFEDMLIAVTRHPAMLYFLNNNVSVGPRSPLGLHQSRGLNENLGREILELHTLGVDGGYQQRDVIALAKALSGWTVDEGRKSPDDQFGRFVFRAAAHEPGEVRLLDTVYRGDGEAQATEILRALARHKSTAAHLSRKLAQHFIADEPADRDVENLTRVYRDGDGDLSKIYAALIHLDESWSQAFSKIKQPWDYVTSSLRVLNLEVTTEFARPIDRFLRNMGQPTFTPPGPQGWYDTAADWTDAASFKERVIWASNVAHRRAEEVDPAMIAQRALGPFLKADTYVAIKGAGSREEALTLLVACPEFQRR